MSNDIRASAAAKRLGVSVQTIYRWVQAGKVEGFQSAGHWYVRLPSLAAFVGPERAAALGVTAEQQHDPG